MAHPHYGMMTPFDGLCGSSRIIASVEHVDPYPRLDIESHLVNTKILMLSQHGEVAH
jgi:hypothetical protein